MQCPSTLVRGSKMFVIDQDRYSRISFNTESRFLRLDLLPAFNEMTIEMLQSTLTILSDVIEEQGIECLLVDSQPLHTNVRDQLGGLELYSIVMQFNDTLSKLAILCSELTVDDACNRVFGNTRYESKIQMFMDEDEAVDWALR